MEAVRNNEILVSIRFDSSFTFSLFWLVWERCEQSDPNYRKFTFIR